MAKWGEFTSFTSFITSSPSFPWILTFLSGATMATTGWLLATTTSSFSSTKWIPLGSLFTAKQTPTPTMEPYPRFQVASSTLPPMEHGSSSSSSSSSSSTEEKVEEDESQTLLGLLYNIAEDQARKEGFVHRGITCNHCGSSPIRGLRYKCSNCADFDLCETCESQGTHTSTHLFLKIKVPIPPLANPRSTLLTIQYPGVPGSHEPLTWERLQTLQTQTHFDHIELEALYEEYKSLAPTDQGITKSIFEKCLGPLGQEKNLIAERIFQFFDTDGNDQIDFSELVHGLSVLCKGNLDEKALYAFHGYDLNGDGHIDQDELHAMFKAYFHLSMELVRDIVKALEEEMMDSFDDENNKPVSAMFTAPIPPSSTPPTSTSLTTPRPSSSSPSSSSSSSSSFQDFQPPIYNEKEPLEDPSSTSRLELPTLTDQAPSGTSHPPLLPPPPPSSSSSSSSSLPSPLHPEEVSMTPRYKPIMEQMSQDAIAEMVQKTFQSMDIHRKGYIEFPEFKTYVENDSTLISWFETLGSVF